MVRFGEWKAWFYELTNAIAVVAVKLTRVDVNPNRSKLVAILELHLQQQMKLENK